MGELMGTAVKVLLVLLVMSLLGTKIIIQRHDLTTEREKNARLTNDKAEREAIIQQLQEAETNNKKHLAQLQKETHRITQILTEREALIEKLNHDDPQLQLWSATPLPDPIIRLRHRPAATGAGDYDPKLPDHQPVLPASGQPDN